MDEERLAYIEKLNEQEELSREDVQSVIDSVRSLRSALDYAYLVVNFGFEYGSFDMSVLRQDAKAHADKQK